MFNKKEGAIQLSFGMIFSIAMIIAIIGISSYVIVYFLNIGKTTQLGLFYKDFQDEIDEVWNSAITNKRVSFEISNDIESVCFGSLTAVSIDRDYQREYEVLNRYSSNFEKENKNMFLYPPENADEFAFLSVEHLDFSSLDYGFTCFDVRGGEIELRLRKDEFDSEVKISK